MIEKKEGFIFNEEESVVVKSFVITKGEEQIAKGFVGISEEELLKLYETEPELALKDSRIQMLLEPPKPEPTQLDRIESLVSKSQEQIAQEARDAYTLELIEGGVIA